MYFTTVYFSNVSLLLTFTPHSCSKSCFEISYLGSCCFDLAGIEFDSLCFLFLLAVNNFEN